MTSRASKITAKVLWFFPLLLVYLGLDQAKVANDVRNTLQDGISTTAEVLEFDKVDRADVTYGFVSLRATLPDGRVVEKRKMSLPYSLLPLVEGKDSLRVRVNPAAAQAIVVEGIASTQWKIAGIQSAISLVGALLLAVGVYAWNRFLRKRGDPARAPVQAT